MDAARELVKLAQRRAQLNARLTIIEDRIKPLAAEVLFHVEEGVLSDSFRCAIESAPSGHVHRERQVWAGPADGDHEALTEVLNELELVEYLPKKVNSQSLSAFVREHLDPNELLSLEERLLSEEPKPLDPRLLKALKVTERRQIKVTGVPATPRSDDGQDH